jgi:hypothetical protein
LFKKFSWKLFDIENDPSELLDLSRQYPDMVDEMKIRYFEWAKKVGVYEYFDSLLLARPM